MKIYDFSDAVKGEFLGESKRPGNYRHARECGNAGNAYTVKGKHGEAYIVTEVYKWQHPSQVGRAPQQVAFTAADFDTDAVLFCTGKDGDQWMWYVLATPAWIEAAKKNGTLHVNRTREELEKHAEIQEGVAQKLADYCSSLYKQNAALRELCANAGIVIPSDEELEATGQRLNAERYEKASS